MLILKQKTNTPIFKDSFGNEYKNLVVQVGEISTNISGKKMSVELCYYKDVNAILTSNPILQDTFSWDKDGTLATDIDGDTIDLATFMTTVPRGEWKNRIQQVGRVPFDDLSQGIDTTTGLDFRPTETGQAWKEMMLFLPLHPKLTQQTGLKFLDEIFEYDVI